MHPAVLGPTVDDKTRCVHYRTELDIIAIRFACCGDYYPCHLCHEETADHPSFPWPAGSDGELAVLCGECRVELTIAEYRGAASCPHLRRWTTCGSPGTTIPTRPSTKRWTAFWRCSRA